MENNSYPINWLDPKEQLPPRDIFDVDGDSVDCILYLRDDTIRLAWHCVKENHWYAIDENPIIKTADVMAFCPINTPNFLTDDKDSD